MTRWIDTHALPDNPNLDFETALWQEGCLSVGGLDEAGRGAWAGPVVAAVVVLPSTADIAYTLTGVNDSKQLTANQRQNFEKIIKVNSAGYGIGQADHIEIDSIGILAATRLAMMRALEQLSINAGHLLIDYLHLPDYPLKQTALIKGDARSLSIACASILAKTHRDAIMTDLDQIYPGYGFASHKGYGTQKHRAALEKLGVSTVHRKSFRPVSAISCQDYQP